jgi:hypothetical protein
MTNDYFASSTLSLILSWVFSIPALLGIIAYIFSIFVKHEGVSWIFSTWVGLCFFVFSPIRYIFFLLVAATSYPFQSVFAFFSIFWLALLVPIAFCLLYAIGFGGPLLIVYWILGTKSQPSRLHYFVSGLAVPVVAFIGMLVFSLALPVAAISTHALRAEDVIRATNGPAYYVFLSQSKGMIALPPYFDKTPQANRDYLRSHVALLYLTDKEHVYFLKIEYPELYDEFQEAVSKL